MEREREGADSEGLVATVMRLKADRILEVAVAAGDIVTNGVTAAHEARQSISELNRSTEESLSRSSAVASSIDQLRLVADSTEAAGTDREANELFELANQIGALTSRFVC